MLEINNQKRGSGKTRRVIKLMEEDDLALCLVPYHEIKRLVFPKELQKRVISERNVERFFDELQGRKYNKIYIDELLYSNFFVAELFYKLGQRNIEVIVYGSD